MRAVVVGGGVGGLVAARRLADEGVIVTVLEASDVLGGRVARVRLGDVDVDSGAESFAVRGGVVSALLDELGLGADVVDPEPGGAWVALADRTVPLPAAGLLGIPGLPLAPDVVAVLGRRAALRAWADRLVPMVRPDPHGTLGALVRRRMGDAVLTDLVAPVVESVYGVDPDAVPVDAIAPALARVLAGSAALSDAVQRVRSSAPPGSAVQGLRGGVHRLVDALAADLDARGVTVRTGLAAIGLRPEGAGHVVETRDGPIAADLVVLAADGAAAARLLGADPAGDPARPAETRAVHLLVDDPRLDVRPRGSGVLRAAGRSGITATALTHATAKWGWLRDALPAHRHVLRLSYRGAEPVPASVARADASALLGVDLPEPRATAETPWRDTAPPLDPRVRARRGLAERAPAGVGATGSWLAGTGLASVVAHADRTARALIAAAEDRPSTP